MRPIDANELKTHSFQVDISDCESESAVLLRDIDEAPTLDVRPVVHGHWIRKWDTHCSACGVGFSEMPYSYDTEDGPGYVEKFCPNCGAIMDEKEEL